MTKPHTNRVRIGRMVPPGDINIAYIDTPKPSIADIGVVDLTSLIPGNAASDVKEALATPNMDHVLVDSVTLIPFTESTQVHHILTDRFGTTTAGATTPLYYRYTGVYKHSEVIAAYKSKMATVTKIGLTKIDDVTYFGPHLNWQSDFLIYADDVDVTTDVIVDTATGVVTFEIEPSGTITATYSYELPAESYTGSLIKVTLGDHDDVPADEAVAIELRRAGTNLWLIDVYTSDAGGDLSYVLHYNAVVGGSAIPNYPESMDPRPFFREVPDSDIESGNFPEESIYSSPSVGSTHVLKVPPVGGSITTRVPKGFHYRVQANYDALYNVTNPRTLKVGLLRYGAAPSACDSFLKTLHQSTLKPGYLTLENPHPPAGMADKTATAYWAVPTGLPEQALLDYDVILLIVAGIVDIGAATKAKLENFIEQGGHVWVDAPSVTIEASNLPAGLTFKVDTYPKPATAVPVIVTTNGKPLERVIKISSYGVQTIVPPNTTSANCSALGIDLSGQTGWTTYLTFKSPFVVDKKLNGKGRVVGTCGRTLTNGEIIPSLQFAVNMLVTLAEDVWFTTPWMTDILYARNELHAIEYQTPDGHRQYEDKRTATGELVARKILSSSIGDFMAPYVPPTLANCTVRYYISSSAAETVPLTIEPLNPITDSTNGFYAYVTASAYDGFIDNSIGSDVSRYYPTITGKAMLKIFAYSNGLPVYAEQDWTQNALAFSISAAQPFEFPLARLLAGHGWPTDGTIVWSNTANVFCEVTIETDDIAQQDQYKVQCVIRDFNGQILNDKQGRPIITGADIEQAVVRLSTTYQNLAVDAKRYSLLSEEALLVLPPVSLDEREIWLPRIKNGRYVRTGEDKRYVYTLPEYSTQPFSEMFGLPYKDMVDELAVVTDDYTIKVAHYPILSDAPIRVVRRERNTPRIVESLVREGTTSTFCGTHGQWVPIPKVIDALGNVVPLSALTFDYRSGKVTIDEDVAQDDPFTIDYHYVVDTELTVESCDFRHGVIRLAETVSLTDEILVEYTYEEQFYHYPGYSITDKPFQSLDLNPSAGHYCTDDNTYRSTSDLIGKSIHLYLLPAEIYTRSTGGTWALADTNNIPLRHTFDRTELDAFTLPTNTNGPALHLATVMIGEPGSYRDVVLLDSRTRGGGLKNNVTDAMMVSVQPESKYNWDIGYWDGESFQSSGVVVIRIPRTVLKNEGGNFDDGQVKDIVGKYVALGLYPLIEYVDLYHSTAALRSKITIRRTTSASLMAGVQIVRS